MAGRVHGDSRGEREEGMLKIGDFSRLGQVSVKMLRHYAVIGLLTPARVDGESGYRYYTLDQLPRLNRILVLKELGFSLEQVARLVDEGLSTAEMQGMLRLKQAVLEQHLARDQERLRQVAERIRQIEREGTMPRHEVILKTVPPTLVASVRDTIPTYQDIGQLIGEVYGFLGPRGLSGTCGACWHEAEYKERDVDAEAFVIIDRPVPGEGRVQVHELPAETLATAIHPGSYRTINDAYRAVEVWVGANGYTLAGPARELYLQAGQGHDDESAVTEIQFPVRKAAG
jgi:DNA-binding transcriptional MerR regulator